MRKLCLIFVLSVAAGATANPLFYGLNAFTAPGGGGGSACAAVEFAGTDDPCPVVWTLSTTTAGAHIFYTLGNSATDPTHTGDTATGSTFKIASTSGNVNTGGTAGSTKWIRALAYKSGLTDSIITEAGIGLGACNP